MPSSIGYARSRTAPGQAPAAPGAPGCHCPVCGGLECLCRPRFFAGQLLTEQELNRLDRYILEKNRLHNRYLHGWGVACGLDVACDSCAGGVRVTPGYAVSPCGNDIVVCADAPVNVCDLINKCRQRERDDCLSPAAAAAGCEDGIQEWVLAICYNETPSRGITPLRGGAACGCGGGCGCGGSTQTRSHGSSPCGCGGGGNGHNGNGHNGASSSTAKPRPTSSRAAAVECEPTVVCEGYRFAVYKAPPRVRRPSTDDAGLGGLLSGSSSTSTSGEMADRFLACTADLIELIPDPPPAGSSKMARHDWCCAVKDALAEYLRIRPGYSCLLVERVAAIVCPDPTLPDAEFEAAMTVAGGQFGQVALELLFSCMCGALMPPCPPGVTADCVPLATVFVQHGTKTTTVDPDTGATTTTTSNGGQCRLLYVCNWTTLRRYLITAPNLRYWLSSLPCGRMLRESLEQFCCGRGLELSATARRSVRSAARPMMAEEETMDPADAGGPEEVRFGLFGEEGRAEDRSESAFAPREERAPGADRFMRASPAAAFHPKAATARSGADMLRLTMRALNNLSTSYDSATLLRGILGQEDETGRIPLDSLERRNLFQALVLDQMAKPIMRQIIPAVLEEGGPLAGLAMSLGGRGDWGESRESPSGSVSALEEQLQELRRTVESQQRTITTLIERLDR